MPPRLFCTLQRCEIILKNGATNQEKLRSVLNNIFFLPPLAVRQGVEEAGEVLADDVGEFVFEHHHADVPLLVEPRPALSGSAQFVFQAICPVIEDLTNLNALLNLVYLTPFKENLFDISLTYQNKLLIFAL